MPFAAPGPPSPRATACPIGPDLWFRRAPDGSYVGGLTEGGVQRAGRIARFRGPTVGRTYTAGESALSLESEKWVGHLGLPVDGTVLEGNASAEADPSLILRDPYGAGWLYRMRPRDPGALEARAGRRTDGEER